MSLKKILILGKLPPPYMGPSIATEIILNSSLKARFELLHLDTKVNESLTDMGKWSIKKVWKNFEIYFRLRSMLVKNNPDLVWIPISQTTTGFIKDSVFILLSKIYKKKVILHLRGSEFKNWLENKTSFLTKWYVKSILKIAQGVIVLGNNLKYLFEDYFTPDKIFVVPNGANYLISDIRKNSNLPVKIIYLANLQTSKGIEDVIEALILLQTRHKKKFEATIIGGWRKEETKIKCLEQISKNNLPVTIYPPESSGDKFIHLAASDIFVFTPREPEGHPWVIIEAMAAGLPVISTDQGAITESVLNNVNGFIVETRNPPMIAEKLKLLIDNETLRKQMAERSRNFYLAKFTEKAMVENLTYAFNSIIKS